MWNLNLHLKRGPQAPPLLQKIRGLVQDLRWQEEGEEKLISMELEGEAEHGHMKGGHNEVPPSHKYRGSNPQNFQRGAGGSTERHPPYPRHQGAQHQKPQSEFEEFQEYQRFLEFKKFAKKF